ncbi:MAG: hypothetical protein HY537_18620 [Deltaproteobacteria bacterium]|nr:hypothetical protein [Deltaproteobacteria bacterium]
MKLNLITCLLLVVSSFAWSTEINISYKFSSNGYAVVAGTIAPHTPHTALAIESGGLVYSSIPDLDGNWAIVFHPRSSKFTVKAWERDRSTGPIFIVEDSLDKF